MIPKLQHFLWQLIKSGKPQKSVLRMSIQELEQEEMVSL